MSSTVSTNAHTNYMMLMVFLASPELLTPFHFIKVIIQYTLELKAFQKCVDTIFEDKFVLNTFVKHRKNRTH